MSRTMTVYCHIVCLAWVTNSVWLWVCLEVCGFFNFDFPLSLDLPFYKFEVSVLYYSQTLIIEIERPRSSNVPRFTVHFDWSKVSNLTYSSHVTVHSDWLNVSILTYSPGERYIRARERYVRNIGGTGEIIGKMRERELSLADFWERSLEKGSRGKRR